MIVDVPENGRRFLGRSCRTEVAAILEIFSRPKHPYTKVLCAAVPGANGQDRVA